METTIPTQLPPEERPLGPNGIKLGRRRKYEADNEADVETCRKKLESYLCACACVPKQPTHTGLAVSLGISRKQLLVYRKREDAIGNLCDEAVTYVEEGLEESMVCGGKNVVGSIFVAKNLGWTDQTDINVTGDANISIVFDMPQSDYEKQLEKERSAK